MTKIVRAVYDGGTNREEIDQGGIDQRDFRYCYLSTRTQIVNGLAKNGVRTNGDLIRHVVRNRGQINLSGIGNTGECVLLRYIGDLGVSFDEEIIPD
jgi:hypothetical protein